jgi:hypothetical protein
MPYRISKHFVAWSTQPETCNAIPETEIFIFRNEKLGLRLVHATGICNAIPKTGIFIFKNEKLVLRLVDATGNMQWHTGNINISFQE